MTDNRSEIRIALPSKGRLAEETLDLLAAAGLRVHKPNPRQYRADIPSLPGLTVLFQRAGDIVVSVRKGSVDFGITGWDVVSEQQGVNGEVLVLLPELSFGFCTLNVIAPESWLEAPRISELLSKQRELGRPLRVASKYPNLTRTFFANNSLPEVELIEAEGALEIVPTIGYADLIVDLVSTGTTLRDNRLTPLEDGQILKSQACLIANRALLKNRPKVLAVARQLLEFIVASLRALENVAVFANIRGETPELIAERMFDKSVIGGLQGPTISPVITQLPDKWYAVHLIVRKDQLGQAIDELRQVGGSGVVVAPVTYIFEEEPKAYKDVLTALEVEC
jgi:ATP phosphoribosyltransferase